MSPSKISPGLGYQFFRPVQWPLSTILFHNHFYLSGCSSDKFFTKCLLFYRGALMPLLQKEVLYSWYVLSQHSSPGKPQRQYSLHLSLLLFQPQCLQIFKVYNCRACSWCTVIMGGSLPPKKVHLAFINLPFSRWHQHPGDWEHFSVLPVSNLAPLGQPPSSCS